MINIEVVEMMNKKGLRESTTRTIERNTEFSKEEHALSDGVPIMMM